MNVPKHRNQSVLGFLVDQRDLYRAIGHSRLGTNPRRQRPPSDATFAEIGLIRWVERAHFLPSPPASSYVRRQPHTPAWLCRRFAIRLVPRPKKGCSLIWVIIVNPRILSRRSAPLPKCASDAGSSGLSLTLARRRPHHRSRLTRASLSSLRSPRARRRCRASRC